MTFLEIVTAVQVWAMNRPEATPAFIKPIVNKVYLSLAMPFRFHETESEHLISTVAGTRDYALPTGTLYALHYGYDRYYGARLRVVDIGAIDRQMDVEDVEGAPTMIARFGSIVRLNVAPDHTTTDALLVRGVVLPTKLVDDAEELVYPEDWHWIVELQAASIVCFMLGMEERGQLLQNMALGQISGRQEPHTLEAFTKEMQKVSGYRGRFGSPPEIK